MLIRIKRYIYVGKKLLSLQEEIVIKVFNEKESFSCERILRVLKEKTRQIGIVVYSVDVLTSKGLDKKRLDNDKLMIWSDEIFSALKTSTAYIRSSEDINDNYIRSSEDINGLYSQL